jgi:tagatose-1,6-bisphosphate aldolase non-catalytic subunit AgaZ/GatZ
MSDEALARIDQLLQMQQDHHRELAELIEQYRAMVFEADEQGPEALHKVVTGLPGGKYHVLTTHLRETWLVLQADLARLMPEQSGTDRPAD